MRISDLADKNGEWLNSHGPFGNIVVSSRVRFARNLAKWNFISKMSNNDRLELTQNVKDAFCSLSGFGEFEYFDFSGLSRFEKTLLIERHLVSGEHTVGEGARGVVIDHDEKFSIMVNEEDHLRMQSLRGGFDLEGAYKALDALDDKLAPILNYAYSEDYGYLTACPTNVGTGMRVSVMLHLPALVMTRHIEKAFRAIHDLRLAVRGFYGEGTEAIGELYQISNQITLGRSEKQILEDLTAVIEELVAYEIKARAKLFDTERPRLEDRVFRAYGVLSNARVITSEEAMKHFSSVRLGLDMGIISGLDMAVLNKIFLYSQAAHLQHLIGTELPPEERDIKRAEFIREQMGV